MSEYDTSMSNTGNQRRRVSVEDAARILGISENAVRKRIERGTLESERDGDTRYVLLYGDMTQHADDMSDGMPVDIALMQAHLDSLDDQIAFLRTELETRTEEARRKDSIIMSLTQRIPELEAPPEPRESPVSSSEEQERGKGRAEPETATAPSSWWRRFFGA
jgi:hypothetical protein